MDIYQAFYSYKMNCFTVLKLKLRMACFANEFGGLHVIVDWI